MKRDSMFCPQCDGIRFGSDHRCPPRWLVRDADDDTPFDEMDRPIYGRDAVDAAETFALQYWNDDGGSPIGLNLEVCNYPALDTVTSVFVETEFTIVSRGKKLSVRPYVAFADDESEEPAP